MLFIPRKMQHGIAKYHICKFIGERDRLELPDLEVLLGQSRIQRGGKPAHMVDASGILVNRKDFTPLAQQVDEVASIPASSVEHAHSGHNVPTQNLIEDIYIDLSELFLNT